jgi:hypothetical protein
MVSIIAMTYAALSPQAYCGQNKMRPTVDPDGQSSIPPIPGLFACVRTLYDQPYAEKLVQDCLHSIVGHGHIEAGRIETIRDEYGVEVHFIVRSPVLTLTEVELGIPPEWMRQFEVMTKTNTAILHVGDNYDENREVLTEIALEQLLRAIGVEGYVSRRLYLDYSKLTARVTFQIWKGPTVPAQRLLPPYGEDCQIYRKTFLLIDIDDHTPLPIVERLSKTSSSICFSDSVVRDDEDRLNQSGLFTTAAFSVTGEGDSRDVSLKIRAKQAHVEKVEIKGHGLLTASDLASPPAIPLTVGQIYSRSTALRSRDTLQRFYLRPGRRVKVLEEDEVVANGELKVTFHIVAAPENELFVDGQEIPAVNPKAKGIE